MRFKLTMRSTIIFQISGLTHEYSITKLDLFGASIYKLKVCDYDNIEFTFLNLRDAWITLINLKINWFMSLPQMVTAEIIEFVKPMFPTESYEPLCIYQFWLSKIEEADS